MRPWSTTETAYLSKLSEKHGRGWKIISELLGRTQKECYNKVISWAILATTLYDYLQRNGTFALVFILI
ncbi:3545_t:CDS:2, partial [Dentiscutata heterogama]